jgi:N-acetylglucosamine kinase-like BadF-type ATPase
VVVQQSDRELANFVVPTSHWWARGDLIHSRHSARALVDLIPVPVTADSALVVGAHGVDSEEIQMVLRRALEEEFPGLVQVYNDAALIGPAAGYSGAVITVIAGTGSIVFGRFADGRTLRYGGHGFLFGDEGSAPALVRDLVREIARAADHGSLDTVALDRLVAAAGLGRSANPLADMVLSLHRRTDQAFWGSLAPGVFDAADAGSDLAAKVISEHARELASLVNGAFRMGVAPDAVVLAGGVLTAQPRLSDAVTAGIVEEHPRTQVEILGADPVTGACLLAREELELRRKSRNYQVETTLEGVEQ